MEFWLISVPTGKNKNILAETKAKVGDLAVVRHFDVPNGLRVGTLDNLMAISDDLYKIDSHVESACRRLVHLFSAVSELDHLELPALNQSSADQYLTKFKWYESKYSISAPLKDLTGNIAKNTSRIDDETRQYLTEWGQINQAIGGIERKQKGNLMIRNLDDVIKPEHVFNSEFMCTVFVVVPSGNYKDWNASYERLSQSVVPRSSKLIFEDKEYGLFSAVVFKKYAEEFKNNAREKRFTVREHTIEATSSKDELEKLVAQRDRLKKNLSRWTRANFEEVFSSWIHLKGIRVFVESVLRFGLPAEFTMMILEPNRKSENRLRSALDNHFDYLSSSFIGKSDENSDGAAMAGFGSEKFYPYVYTAVSLSAMTER